MKINENQSTLPTLCNGLFVLVMINLSTWGQQLEPLTLSYHFSIHSPKSPADYRPPHSQMLLRGPNGTKACLLLIIIISLGQLRPDGRAYFM